MINQSDNLRGIQLDETDAESKKVFCTMAQEQIDQMVTDMFMHDREGFFQFAFYLRKFDKEDAHTE